MLSKRLESIANLLQETGSVEVSDLSRRYGVTEKTIRQDLIKLAELRIATRVHGGAPVSYTHLDVYKRQTPSC